jgi:YaiO family outer membrane protein
MIFIFRIIPLFCVFAMMLDQVRAQDVTAYSNPEEGFALMRSYAEKADYDAAKQLGYSLLEEQKDYHDVALYLARVHGWEGSFDSAYMVLDTVISRAPELSDAYLTCVDLAYWDNNWDRFEDCAEKALELGQDSLAVMEKYRLFQQQRDMRTDHTEAILHFSYDHFSDPYLRNWIMMTAGFQVPIKPVLLIPYVNAGYNVGSSDVSSDLQINLDAYVTLGKKNYAMAGYGFSPDGETNYLPVHRAAAEFWQILPKGFGLSAGARYFYWKEPFTFLTFTAEKYAGKYWFSFRNYLFFKDYGVSGSYYLSGRRYFATRFDHLTLTVGYGTAPDEPVTVITDLDRMSAVSGRIEYSKQFGKVIRMILGFGYAYEEYFDEEYRNRWNVKAGCNFRLGK